jgi:hypothetical protein
MRFLAAAVAYAMVAVLTITTCIVWMMWPIIGYDED